MRNIQVIDGADNCTYSVFAVDDEGFRTIFPGEGQDVEFIEDLVARVGEDRAAAVLADVWLHPMDKKQIFGLHGTLFFELLKKKRFYPSKMESEMETGF